MTAQQTAEKYVRKQIPELMELNWGCSIKVNLSEGGGTLATVVGVTPHLVHWSWAEHHSNKGSFVGSEMLDRIEIIGHPIQLQHWLRVLADKGCRCDTGMDVISMSVYGGKGGDYSVVFNLTTGQPATEVDYQAFNEIVRTTLTQNSNREV